MGNFWKVIKKFLTQFKMRTLLAMLGVMVGTASVVAMVSSGQMATEEAIAQFKSLGTDMMSITLSDDSSDKKSTAKIPFTFKQAENIAKVSSDIVLVAPYISVYGNTTYGGKPLYPTVIATTEALAQAIHIGTAKGRFISILDNSQPYCVMGFKVFDQLENKPLKVVGTQIRIGSTMFTIIGIANEWPENAFFNQDVNNSLFIPVYASRFISKDASVDNIVLRLKSNVDITAVQNKITDYLNQVAPQKKAFFRSSKQLVESMAAQRQIFTILLGCIGSVSLLVGGIGVMNIMLVSVLERRREIGLRLAIGAKRRDIQLLFLREAIQLSIVGGLIGVVFGIIFSLIIGKFAHWHLRVFFWPPLIGFLVSVATGAISGYYPARQASLLNPIETLHAE